MANDRVEHLNPTQLTSWTNSSHIANLLFYTFNYMVQTNKINAENPELIKILENITSRFDPKGVKKLPIHIDKRSLVREGSDSLALLGAYFFSKEGGCEPPLVTLSPAQIAAVHEFVSDIVPPQSKLEDYPQSIVKNGDTVTDLFLRSFSGSPQQKHAEVIKQLIFHKVDKSELFNKDKMSNDKYKEGCNDLLGSVFSLTAFSRTPLEVLNLQASQSKDKTSGIDLQLTNTCQAITMSLQKIDPHPWDSEAPKDKYQTRGLEGNINGLLSNIRVSFGIEKTRLELQQKIDEQQTQILRLQKKLEENDTQLKVVHEEFDTTLEQLKAQNERLQSQLQQYTKPTQQQSELVQKGTDDLTRELEQSQSNVQSLQSQNSGLKEQVLKQQEMLDFQTELNTELATVNRGLKVPKEDPILRKKIDLLQKLAVENFSQQLRFGLSHKITECKDLGSLNKIESNIDLFKIFNQRIEAIKQGILNRSGFFSGSDAHKKVDNINKAYEQLTYEDLQKLVQFKDADFEHNNQDKLSPTLVNFISVIKQQRGFLEAKSFVEFKKAINELNNNDSDNHPNQLDIK